MDNNPAMCYNQMRIIQIEVYLMNITNHSVNITSDKYLQVNNCSIQTRDTGFTVTRSEGWRDYHILLIISGKCIATHKGKEYVLFPGGVVLYTPGEAQKYTFLHECKSLWIHFSGTAVGEILNSCSLKSGAYQLKPDNYLNDIFYTIIKRFHNEKTLKYTNASVIELLCYISDKIHNSHTQNCPSGIYDVANYITQNYKDDFTIEELAKISGYSKSRFSFLFKYHMDKTPVEFLRDIRLSSSCDLLISTNLSINEISLCCGYVDALYFSRIFKDKYGVSPTQYRKEETRKQLCEKCKNHTVN